MTETESLIAEVRHLRADIARLHAAHTPVHFRHGWMNLLFQDLSTNPYTQYKVHMWGAIYWLINFPLICLHDTDRQRAIARVISDLAWSELGTPRPRQLEPARGLADVARAERPVRAGRLAAASAGAARRD